MTLKKINKYSKDLTTIFRNYKNWYTVFLDYLGFVKEGEIIYKLRNGVKLKANKMSFDREIINDIWIHKQYNPPGFEIEKNSIVIDIGAHKGFFSIFAATIAQDGKVYSFEPSPYNYNILLKNLEYNNLNNVKTFNIGVTGTNGKEKLYISKEGSINNLRQDYGDFVEVNCETLENIFKRKNIDKCDFLKMDCEGAEYEILFNTSEDILKRINKISLELHLIPEYDINTLNNFLIDKRFKIWEKTIENPPKVNYPGVKMLYCIRKG